MVVRAEPGIHGQEHDEADEEQHGAHGHDRPWVELDGGRPFELASLRHVPTLVTAHAVVGKPFVSYTNDMTVPQTESSPALTELASLLRIPVLRLARTMRNQRVDISVSLTQLSALGALKKHGPMSAGELAAVERVQPPSMTKVIAQLEERGLVTREVHPTDKRQAIIAVTNPGCDLLLSEQRLRDAWLSHRLEALTDEERAALRAVAPILDKLAEQ